MGTRTIIGRSLCIVVTLLAGVPISSGQTAAALNVAPPASGDLEPVVFPLLCEGWVWGGNGWELDFLDMRISADGDELAWAYIVDYWDMYAALSVEVEIGQFNRTVLCTLESGHGSDWKSLTFDRRHPEELWVLNTWGYSYGWGRYFYRRERQVRDNYGKAYAYAGVPVGESYWIGNDGCAIGTIATGAIALRSDGTFSDDYATNIHVPAGPGIKWCADHPQPANCSTSMWQTINVEGAWNFTHEVEWRCDNVFIGG